MSAAAGTADFDRDATNYEPTMHLINQLKDRKALTTEMVAEAIEVVIDVDNRKVVTACERGR